MTKLQRFLTINSFFSALSGILMILFWQTMLDIFGINNTFIFQVAVVSF